MIGGKGNQGVSQLPPLPEVIQQSPQHMIAEGDLSVIGLAIFRSKGLGCLVVRVGIKQVQPEKPGAPLLDPLKKLLRSAHSIVGGGLAKHESRCPERLTQIVVVDIEALGEPKTRIQHEGADHGPRGVALLGKQSGQGGHILRQAMGPVVTRTVPEGQLTGEDRGM